MQKQLAIEYYGSTYKLAKALKITPHAIYQWKEVVPIKQASKLERITKGALKVQAKMYE